MRRPQRRGLHRLKHSLRARLLTLFVLLALATTLVFVAGTSQVFSSGWRELIRPLALDYVSRLAAEIGDPPDIQKAQAITARLPLSITISGPRVNWQSALPSERFLAEPRPHDQALRSMLTRRTSDGHELRFSVRSFHWDDERPRWLAWLTLAALLALTAAAFAYVRHLFKPLDDVRAGALRYEAGDFSTPIPQRRRDELGDLADQVNAMAKGLERMLDGQRGMLLAISHELRSPLTRARLNTELLNDGPERSALLRDLGQMRDLIANLLESERLAAGRATLQLQPTDLGALVGDFLDTQFAGQPIERSLEAGLPLLQVDATRMQLLVRNLIDNALRHGGQALSLGDQSPRQALPQSPAVRVSLRRAGAAIRLSVRDHGLGVSTEQLSHLAQAFYRPDAARTRTQGGVGLGLYLCQQVAQSHGGRLLIERAEPGLEVSLEMPAPQGEERPSQR